MPTSRFAEPPSASKRRQNRLQRVAVYEGKVEVRHRSDPARMLLPGDVWWRPGTTGPSAPAPASVSAPARSRTPAPVPRSARAAPSAAIEPPVPAPLPETDTTETDTTEAEAAAAEPAPVESVRPTAMELAYARGWEALRREAWDESAQAFAEVPRAHPLGAEAAYWRIVALTRSGATPAHAMEAFLRAHPESRRVGEVALQLGFWRLEAADNASAEPLLREAAKESAPGDLRPRGRGPSAPSLTLARPSRGALEAHGGALRLPRRGAWTWAHLRDRTLGAERHRRRARDPRAGRLPARACPPGCRADARPSGRLRAGG